MKDGTVANGARAYASGGLVNAVLLGLGLFLVGCGAERATRAGQAALEEHQLADAEAAFRRALASDPSHVPALAGLGWTYQLAARRDAAGDVFSRCLEVDEEAVSCLRGQASIALAAGNFKDARMHLDRAVALDPDDPSVQTSLGILQSASGDLDEAGRTWERLVARYPERAEATAGLADLRVRQGRLDEALVVVDQGIAVAASEGAAERHRAVLYLLRARILLALTADRVDPAACGTTAPPVIAWLDAAAVAAAQARAGGMDAAELGQVDRLILRRRATIDEQCAARPTPAPVIDVPASNAPVDGSVEPQPPDPDGK
jgi:tetratricopeptide (TPR) repeat protein